jgi:hypothetical protein
MNGKKEYIRMTQLTLQLPQPVYERLREQARGAHLSISELLMQRISRDLGYAVGTAQQARRRALKLLRAEAGLVLHTGSPEFDEGQQRWRVPVVPNLRGSEAEPVGEVLLDAVSGQPLTSPTEVRRMLAEATSRLQTHPLAPEDEARLRDLLAQNQQRPLSSAEQAELEALMKRDAEQSLANLYVLAEQLQLSPVQRAEMQRRLTQARSLETAK